MNKISNFKSFNENQNIINLYQKDFKGETMILNRNGICLFKVNDFREIDGFDKMSAICHKKQYFDMYSKHDHIYFLFKNGIYLCSFSIRKNNLSIPVISLSGNKVIKLDQKIEGEDYSEIYDIIKKVRKSIKDTAKTIKGINN